jgi:hypothetical protein
MNIKHCVVQRKHFCRPDPASLQSLLQRLKTVRVELLAKLMGGRNVLFVLVWWVGRGLIIKQPGLSQYKLVGRRESDSSWLV